MRAAAAAIGWIIAEWIRNGKPSALGAISGCVAGLVAITPAAGFVGPMPALLIGLIGGRICYFMVARSKRGSATTIHLTLSACTESVGRSGRCSPEFSRSSGVNPIFKDAQGNPLPSGMIDGNYHQILNQLVELG